MHGLFKPLPEGPFDFAMIDPPWKFASNSKANPGKNPNAFYRTLTIEQLKYLPIWDVTAKNSVIWVWGTSPMIDRQIEMAKFWGFEFKTLGAWAKTTKTGKQAFGTGYRLRCAMEPFFIATKGKPITAKTVRSLIIGQIGRHSEKPEESYRAAEEMMPGAYRLDCFARERRPGWVGYGDELK